MYSNGQDFAPSVYSHLFVFERQLPHICDLLESKEDEDSCGHEKGLDLAQRLISLISVASLPAEFADTLRSRPIEKSLINIMRYSTLSANRKKALVVFKLYLSRYTNLGRYHFLYRIIAEPGQPTVVSGLDLTLYKDLVVSESDASAFYRKNLHKFLKKAMAVCLPNGTETDLIENNETIMTTMNLIRFLSIRDSKTVNETKIWDMRESIQDKFLGLLRTAIDSSRTQFNMKLCKIKDEAANPTTSSKSQMMDINVMNSGKDDNNEFELPENHEFEVIQVSLVTLDMMESVLVRVIELVE